MDPKSRHKGKLDTEDFLRSMVVNFTSVRPVYIYGPLNYNPLEEWRVQNAALIWVAPSSFNWLPVFPWFIPI